MIGRLALVLTVAVAGATGLHATVGVAAAACIIALFNAYPWKVRS